MAPTPTAPRTPDPPRASLPAAAAGEVDLDSATDLLRGMSRPGLVPAIVASVSLWGGLALALRYGNRYLDADRGLHASLLGGALLLALAGWMVHRLIRRRDYPWLMFVAAVAIPLYEPQAKPDTLFWRLSSALYGLALVLVAVHAFVRMVRRTDELERRVNHEALSFAFAASLVIVMAWSLLQDVLPPMRGLWVASAMIAAWLVGWNAAVRKYR
jgi:MFS family permease